jgi:hypothetical protein
VIRRALLALTLAVPLLAACSPQTGQAELGGRIEPLCHDPTEAIVLLAQAVQGATKLPCIAGYPAGWSYGGDDVRKGSGTFWLDSAIAGAHAVEITLTPSCDETRGEAIDPGMEGVEATTTNDPGGETRRYIFEGGCVEQTIALGPDADDALLAEADLTLGFLDRAEIAATLREDYGVTLCGAGAEPCAG